VTQACAIDEDCIGGVSMTDHLDGDQLPLCEFHHRELSEIGERGFREWYSVALEG
jgi:hypothetical protein